MKKAYAPALVLGLVLSGSGIADHTFPTCKEMNDNNPKKVGEGISIFKEDDLNSSSLDKKLFVSQLRKALLQLWDGESDEETPIEEMKLEQLIALSDDEVAVSTVEDKSKNLYDNLNIGF